MNNQTFLIDRKKIWSKFLNLIPHNKKDIYYNSEYVDLYKNRECSPKCFIINQMIIYFYPFIKRRISGMNYYDTTTPYGYGGPIIKNYIKNLYCLNNYYESLKRIILCVNKLNFIQS